MTSNANSIAQKASFAALKGSKKDIEVMRQEYVRRRDYMVGRINSIDGLSCKQPQGAFYIFMKVADIFGKHYKGIQINASAEFAKELLENYQVAVVPSEGFGMQGYIRLSYATSMRNIMEGLNRIESFVRELV
jgi:aspartate aminotransferase